MGTVTVQTHETTRSGRWLVWTGRIVSVVPVLVILMSSRWKLTSNPWYVHEWGRIGWKTPDLPFIASLQLGAILLYVIPRTSVLGAVILTGYLGGAIASYVRIGELYPPRPTHNGDARLVGNLFARRASSSAASIPQECVEDRHMRNDGSDRR